MRKNIEKMAVQPAMNACSRGVTLEGEMALSVVDALSHGRLAESASKLEVLPAMRGVAQLQKEVVALNCEKNLEETVTRIALCLSEGKEFSWSMASNLSERERAKDKLVSLDSHKDFEESVNGLSVCVGAGERSQLRYDFSGGPQESLFAHYLIKPNFDGVGEVFAALRWLHGNDDEEVMLRLRPASVVVGRCVEVSLLSVNAFNHVAVGRHMGRDIVLLNGIPVYWCQAQTPSPTGVTLDFIGTTPMPSRADVPLFVVAKNGLPLFLRDTDVAQWLEWLLLGHAQRADLAAISRCLHVYSGVEAPLSKHTYDVVLAANLSQRQGYRDHITDQLIERLPVDVQSNALAELVDLEPPIVLKVQNATVRISSNPSLHASLGRLIGRHAPMATLLDDINFRAYAGDIVGIIGKNGAGKSTLLKTLVAAMPLLKGCISVSGRPILLRPGAGMQGDLTGRENVLKTGLYMGFLPDELRELMDEIIEFAELKEHIDRPFRYYSDGMRARLVFALATAIPRDILLLDELLSAGDMGFQRKAMKRLDDFIARAKLVLVVQHTFDFVLSRCTKCLLLDRGRPVYYGDPTIATEMYKESL